MKSAGSLIFLWLLSAALHASVTASLDTNLVKKGETVTLMLRIDGKKIRMPSIRSLCGVKVEGREHRTEIDDGEGMFKKAELYSFGFRPISDCLIDPIAIEVDGVESYSQPLELKVGRSEEDDRIILKLRSAKKELYVGEPFEVEVVVRKRETAEGLFSAAAAPEMEHIWIKKVFEPIYTKEGGYTVARSRYLLAAQQAGNLHIYPAEIKIASEHQSVDGWGDTRQKRSWESYYSNGLLLKVKALPENVMLVGAFALEFGVDKKEVNPNEPLTAELTIRGVGNFEDIPVLKPTISGVEISAGEPTVEMNGEGMKESWHQKFTFLSASSFTIPPIVLDYFDLKDEQVKRVETQPVSIHVAGSEKVVAPAKNVTEIGQQRETVGTGWAFVIYVMGVLSGALLFMMPWKRWKKAQKRVEKVSVEDYRRVLSMLLMHRDEPDVREMINKLEERLYGGRDEKINQKELKKLLKRYQK
ncbi:MAG: BatD family protein [Thiovulaceae bacterium]|nr:BatD family protein [Sulfurimonadaceae bacterium]